MGCCTEKKTDVIIMIIFLILIIIFTLSLGAMNVSTKDDFVINGIKYIFFILLI